MEMAREYKIQSVGGLAVQGLVPELAIRDRMIAARLSARGRRVALFVLAICVINLFDLALTMRAHADGMLDEQNPLARSILHFGPMALLIFKISVIAGAGYVLFSFRRHRCAELASVLVLIAYVAVAVRWRICYEFYDLATFAWQGKVTEDLFDPVSILLSCL